MLTLLIHLRASAPLSAFRHNKYTDAPALFKSSAVCIPSGLVAFVITATLPVAFTLSLNCAPFTNILKKM